MAELPSQAKYERLAQEYSRLRSNVSVLKRAVLEEKETNTKLTERVKASEVAQRKQEQELEALRFRNQQLVKRVEVLQDDLDAAHAAAPGGKKRGHITTKVRGGAAPPASGDLVGQPDQEVIMEQLQKTIEENARLVNELSDCRSQHEAELRRVRDELHRAQEQSERAQEGLASERATLQAECALLRDEKLTLEKQVVVRETNLQQRIAEVAELRQRLEAVTAGAVVAATDSEVPGSQAMLPTAREAVGISLRLLRGLKEWHDNYGLRLSLPFGPLRSPPQLTDAVSKCSEAAAALEEEMGAMDAALRESKPRVAEERLSSLRRRLGEYSERLSASVDLSAQRMEDESALSFCPPTLAKRNAEMQAAMVEMAAATAELHICVDGGERRNAGEAGARLRQAGRELARLFNCKVSLEQKTAELSDEVKAANEALVHGLLVARSALDKLAPLMADSVFSASGLRMLTEVLLEERGDGPRMANGLPASPCGVGGDSGRLEREVTQLKAALKELEQSRDSLGLEAQLERLRREKEVQKRSELEKELLSLRSVSPGGSLADTSDLGDAAPPDPPSVGGEQREEVIVRYYQDIVGRQQQQLYQLTGVAENLRVEAENARAQWALATNRAVALESEVANLSAHTKGITEDLDSTRRNYETQLSTLTEHIADMNDKLIQRQENIVDLRRQLENKEPPRRMFSATSLLPNVSKRK